MLKQVEKDILFHIESIKKPTVVLHGCNCLHIMGAGIARYLRDTYPIVYEVDKTTTRQADKNKLGTYSVAKINDKFHILNCYTQFSIHVDKYGNPPIDYNALRSCLQKVNVEYDGWDIRTPMIGCGLAGGDWDTVKHIFEEELEKQNVLLYLGARR